LNTKVFILVYTLQIIKMVDIEIYPLSSDYTYYTYIPELPNGFNSVMRILGEQRLSEEGVHRNVNSLTGILSKLYNLLT
ncbi:MAG: hypothetical protein AABW91_04370, partial [Nanoarchaeota archaeon]